MGCKKEGLGKGEQMLWFYGILLFITATLYRLLKRWKEEFDVGKLTLFFLCNVITSQITVNVNLVKTGILKCR